TRVALVLLVAAVAAPPARAATSVKAFNIIAQWDGVSPFEIPGADGAGTVYLGSAVLPLGIRSGLTSLLVGDFYNNNDGAVFRLFLRSDGRVLQQSGLDSILRFGGPTSSSSVSGWIGAQPDWSGNAHFGASFAALSGPSANGDVVVAVGKHGDAFDG